MAPSLPPPDAPSPGLPFASLPESAASLPEPLCDLLAAVAADEASVSDAAAVRSRAATDVAFGVRLLAAERLERALRADSLLPLPLGLVSSVLSRVAAEPFAGRSDWDGAAPDADSAPDSGSVQAVARTPMRPARFAAMAAAALLALGAGLGGLWTATTGDGLGIFNGQDGASRRDGAPSVGTTVSAASFIDLAAAARDAAPVSVRSLAGVSDQLPGSPTALAAGSLVLLGAAVVGARRQGGERRRGRTPEADAASRSAGPRRSA